MPAVIAPELQGMNIPQQTPTHMPAVQQQAYSGAGAPPAGAPAAPLTEREIAQQAVKYTHAGMLSAEQIISGDADRYQFLEPKLLEVISWIQQALVQAERSEDLAKARTNPVLRREISEEIDRLALSYILKERGIRGDDGKVLIAMVINEIVGLGPLEPLWQDPDITEVICNGPQSIYVERAGRLMHARACRFRSQEHLLEVCQRILAPLNRKVDVRDPLADGRLPDGSRVNVVHHSIAPKGPLLTIRRFPEQNRSLEDLVKLGSMDEEMAALVATLIANKASTLVVGGTGSGKTTLLNALSAAIPRHERVITIEDSLELRLHPESHVAAMEARPSDATGANSVTIRHLVKNALRMRPDRIIVGEIRDAAALDMLQACNTGHEGSMSTVHANGPDEAISRLTVMVAQGGEIPANKVDWLIGSALDLIIIAKRYEDGSRRVAGLYEVPSAADLEPGESLKTIPLWEWEQTGVSKTGKSEGRYVKRNDISDHLRKERGLDHGRIYTWEDVVALGADKPGGAGPAQSAPSKPIPPRPSVSRAR